MFGEQTSAVLHSDVQSPSVELHEGNGELKPEQGGATKSTITAEPLNNQQVIEQYEPKKWDSRLIVNRVQVLLERVSFPPARPPFVREQVEADVRVRAVVGERDQVSVEGNDPESEKHRPYCI